MMNKLLAGALLLGLSGAASARTPDVSRYFADNDCTAYLFSAAHPQLSLKSPNAMWIILNMGPSDVILGTTHDPSFEMRYEPWDGGGTPIFAGDNRYRFILSLAPNGKDTKVYVCIPR